MMKRMEQILIKTVEDGAVIEQPVPNEVNASILIPTDQIDIVIKWLEEVRAEHLAEG